MSAAEWFALPTATVNGAPVEAEIRAWVPGDGLACRSSAQAKKIPCGPPIAVVRTHKRRYPDTRPTRSVYCAFHVSEIVRRQLGDADWSGTTTTQATIRKAEETVLAAHWDEYQSALSALAAEQKQRYLRVLPEWLRAGFEAAEGVA